MKRLLRRKVPAPAAPPGLRIYAVGDIHGCRGLLDELLETIGADLSGYAGRSRIVFLGDYIDRGPDSAGVLQRLIAGPGPADEWVCLKGNHDHFAQHLLTEEDWRTQHYRTWLANGGDEAMKSWGLPGRIVRGAPEPAVAALRAAVPAAHRAFLAALHPYHRAGDYLFVHAGIRPGIPLDAQEERDLLWIRGEFLDHGGDFGMHVVHGHTITKAVDTRRNRTGIDTGAYMSGRLTALVLEGEERRVLGT